MGATPMADGGSGDAGLLDRWRRGVTSRHREAAVWECAAHPSLMPTVFAKTERAPTLVPWREVVARKV